MTLLVDFLCRFGWGLSLALVLTPAALVPGGFFRVNLLVILGLSTFAALLARTAVPGPLWLLPAVTAIAAWMGSIVWLAERRRAGVFFCGLCAALLAAATVWLSPGWDSPGLNSTGRLVLARLLSGLVVGLTVHAMLLGHWYLNAPGMRVDALRRLIDWAPSWPFRSRLPWQPARSCPAAPPAPRSTRPRWPSSRCGGLPGSSACPDCSG
jgi:hypothetical protein